MQQDHHHSRQQKLTDCQELLGYRFQDEKLLEIALTHASISVTRLQSNERMEFLGDAILGAIVCDRLFALYPQDEEGNLTQMKSDVVSRTACARATFAIGLDQYIFLSKGLIQAAELPTSIAAGLLESVIAAIYLDGGFQAAFDFVNRHLQHLIKHAAETEHFRNSKSLLQHLSQKNMHATPVYELLDEVGPDHCKHFLVSATIGELSFPPAWGCNKKQAEQKAAMNAMSILNGEEIPYPDSASQPPDWELSE
ncbi:MAG: ribonuclease III [Planctomycetaceae bacterium]|nr:ribonuclease III [Planctomycetaceae bacterium]